MPPLARSLLRLAVLSACVAGGVVGASGAQAAPLPPAYTVLEAFPSGVFRIDHATGSVSPPTLPGRQNAHVAISADATTAYVAEGSSVVPVRLSDGLAGAPIILPTGAAFTVAISPDGSLAYVAGNRTLTPVRLSDGAVLSAVPLRARDIRSVAFSPDGKTVYVLDQDVDNGFVTPIDVTTGKAGSAIDLPTLTGGPFIRVSPDGTRAYVPGNDAVIVIDLATLAVTQIPLGLGGADVASLALSPDGRTLYAGSRAGFVVPVSLPSGTVGTPIALPAGFRVRDVAVTPDGRTLYLSHWHLPVVGDLPAQVLPIDLPTRTVGTPIVTDPDLNAGPRGALAITPDQAPTASFTAAAGCAGTATSFDASASTVRYGTIVRYAWEFGDGSTAITSVAKAAHTYTAPGRYTARVTETDSAGTSTGVVYAGQMVVRNGGPSAVAQRDVLVDACAPAPSRPPAPSAHPADRLPELPATGTTTWPAVLLSLLLVALGTVLLRSSRQGRRLSPRPRG